MSTPEPTSIDSAADSREVVNARVIPGGSLEVLSQLEVNRLHDTSIGGIHETLRRCALAILNVGSTTDDSRAILEAHRDFDIEVIQQDRGIKLDLKNAPARAFVDGRIIRGIQEHLFAVLRDLVYVSNEIEGPKGFPLDTSAGITDAVFHILRNARALKPQVLPNIVVCWGGHAISREEYDYAKEVGHQMGLRGLNVCTGCGPGAMKGPMKGASVGHAKQRIYDGRYIGITEPGIIAAEPPNPMVNQLVIMPDIEKRLEAFLRLGHGVIIFPGGVGTIEELLYLLGILMHPDNAEVPLPVILSGPESARDYFRRVDAFIGATLGEEVRERYRIIIDDPVTVAHEIRRGLEQVRRFRRERSDAWYFNWLLHIEQEFQAPFAPDHESMAKLEIDPSLPPHQLAANLRRAFSGIVAGNVKEAGIRTVEEHGPFKIQGDPAIMRLLDELLASLAAGERMKLPGSGEYKPCYCVVK